ncbi:MAG TPA: 2,3-diaminopropionate biosynthesis protein SbnA [Gaiellales bacterium]|nr:2,3-diaminopropionate biosynthesis protein SbnA [Gaiellales bacterium]
MPIVTDPQEFNQEELYVDLCPVFGHSLFLKVEGFNFAGSIKLKAAAEMVTAAERDGALTADSILVESSSGNLGVALSMLTANKGYRFVCVTDARCNPAAVRLMRALGAEVHVITEESPDGGGLLGARLAHVRELRACDKRYLWLNQYANPANPGAHYRTTAPAIAQRFPDLDVLFIGAGTCGTLMGCARYMREWQRQVRIVAVDTVGSVIFGGPPGRRLIPGVGAAVHLPQLDESYVDDVVMVPEAETIRTCRRLARRGFLFGGSTGTVVSGALDWLSQNGGGDLTTVAISPDLGEHYLETVYADEWVQEHYGDGVLDDDLPEVVSAAAVGIGDVT